MFLSQDFRLLYGFASPSAFVEMERVSDIEFRGEGLQKEGVGRGGKRKREVCESPFGGRIFGVFDFEGGCFGEGHYVVVLGISFPAFCHSHKRSLCIYWCSQSCLKFFHAYESPHVGVF